MAQPRIVSARSHGSRITTDYSVTLLRGFAGGCGGWPRGCVALLRGGRGHVSARRQTRSNPQRSIGWTRSMWWTLRDLVERRLNRAVELRVGAPSVVLGRVVDLDIRVGPVVLDAPADVVEEERKLRLR